MHLEWTAFRGFQPFFHLLAPMSFLWPGEVTNTNKTERRTLLMLQPAPHLLRTEGHCSEAARGRRRAEVWTRWTCGCTCNPGCSWRSALPAALLKVKARAGLVAVAYSWGLQWSPEISSSYEYNYLAPSLRSLLASLLTIVFILCLLIICAPSYFFLFKHSFL